MELRYDPVSDTTEYVETFRAICPVCGTENKAVVSMPNVPRDAIDPAYAAALDRLAEVSLARSRARFMSDPSPCVMCSPQA